MEPQVMILLGSSSDYAIAEKAINILEIMNIPYDVRVASAHRTHQKVKIIVKESTSNGVEVFIGIAGLSAHLPGIIAANTHKPVVGVPVDVKLGGLDALFASVQMPLGAPVAAVGLDRGENGAILAAQIIGMHDQQVKQNLSAMRKEFFFKVEKDEEELENKLKGSYYFKGSYYQKSIEKIENNLSNDLETGFDLDQPDFEPPEVFIIAGSYSDMKVAKKTTMFMDKMNISYETAVISPIRNPIKFESYLERYKDVKLYIAISGLSAHVTGAVVAQTEKPVIGVPCSINLDGLDALLSMVNMPPGVPVATVGIDAGGNAALFAAEMLGIGNESVENSLLRFKGNINCKR